MNKSKQKRKVGEFWEKKFIPHKIPRLLPGSQPNAAILKDLKHYNTHRNNVINARPKIDSNPPKLNPHMILNSKKIMDDARRLQEITRENQNVIKKINLINRTHGKVDTFNPNAYERHSKWKIEENKIKEIEKRNRKFYHRLLKTKSMYSNEEFTKCWKKVLEKMKASCKFGLQFPKNIDQILQESPSISDGLTNVSNNKKRPKVFMDLEVEKGNQKFGRIIIELYDDYVPLTVQNFLSLCKGTNKLSYKNSNFYKIIPGQYCEAGDIVKFNGLGGKSIYGDTFPEENYDLKHTKAGVLSMVTVHKKENDSKFIITFQALPALDGNRVVFGRIIKGHKHLFNIQDLGRKLGKPLENVRIINCGEICNTNKVKRIKK